MKKIYDKINNNKILKTIVIPILIAVILCCFLFIQYENITYNNKVGNIKKEIKELNTKINELKEKETLLEANVNANNSELEVLKNALSTLQNDIKAANDKLNSL